MNDEEYMQWMSMYKHFMNQAEFVIDEDMIRPMYKQPVLLIMNSMRKAAKSKDFIEMKKLLNIFKNADPELIDESKLLPIAQQYLSHPSDELEQSPQASSTFNANVCTEEKMIKCFL